ncbi:MAG: hypothetical protein GOP50_05390 [Candidatus Heimdallarchaeota archaeon]|nr:hypothetical protein [Candidatus Heimdallarchaeota archaeon]
MNIEDLGYFAFLVIILFIAIPISRARKKKKKERSRQRYYSTYNPQAAHRDYNAQAGRSQFYSAPAYQAGQQPNQQHIQRTMTPRSTFDMENILKDLRLTNAPVIQRAMNGFQVETAEDHRYTLFSEIKVIEQQNNFLKIYGTLRKIIPSSLEMRRRSSMVVQSPNEIQIPQLDNFYSISSEHQDLWFEILHDHGLIHRIENLKDHLEFLYINEDHMEAIVDKDFAVRPVLDLTVSLHSSLRGIAGDSSSYQVEELRCYNCDDPFDPLEEECDKCGAQRPRCMICYLDLKPSDKQEVVKHPCCQIYSHKEHILVWLKKNKKCPNCHTDLSHWAKKLML